MSKYTTELRYICEMKSGFSPEQLIDKSITEIITASRPQIFDFNYPLFNPAYKPTLEYKILDHYYTREIGAETYSLWKHYLEMTMNEIMPKYNKLYELETLLTGKMIYNVDIYHDNIRTNNLLKVINGIQTNNLNTLSNSDTDEILRDLFSDTPQGTLNGVDTETYLTTYDKKINHMENETEIKNTGNVKNDTNQKDTGTVDEDGHEYGYRGAKPLFTLLYEYTQKIINIDKMVIDDLSNLFFLLW